MSEQQQQDARDVQQLRNEIAFGLDVQAFMDGQVGKYLQRRAHEVIDGALESLKTADPEDPKAIRALQNEIARCENVLLWLGEAVTAGEQAQQAYVAGEQA